MKQNPVKFIRSQYEDPILENQWCPFPELQKLTIFERRDEAEDPLIPDVWYITLNGDITREEVPLSKIRYKPDSIEDTLTAAKWLLDSMEFIVEFQTINILENDLPLNFVVEIITKNSLLDPLFDMNEWTIQKYIIKVNEGIWEIKEVLQNS